MKRDVELNFDDYRVVIPRKRDLKRLYVEITNRCNLNCRMCFRNFWNCDLGEMSLEQFRVIIDELSEFPELETIYLGGIGEPTVHPDFLQIIRLVKESGYRLEFGTNGTLLSTLEKELVGYGVDRVVVSIDAPQPDIYMNIRGTEFSNVVENVMALQKAKVARGKSLPEVALEAVVMKSNIHVLHKLLPLAYKLGINQLLFTNLMPFDTSLSSEIVYNGSVDCTELVDGLSTDIGKYKVRLDFPRFDLQTERICRFMETKSAVIRWDGEVAPCYRFLHSYTEYIFGRVKKVLAHSFGNVFERGLQNIWTDADYITFRYMIKNSLYPSCTDCSLRDVCDFAKDTDYDCWGTHPSCGDCLWARGLIQCP